MIPSSAPSPRRPSARGAAGLAGDFPIDWPQDQYVARRDFTKFLVLTSLAFVVGQVWIGIRNWLRRGKGEPPLPARPIARLDEVATCRSARCGRSATPDENDPCLLLRPGRRGGRAAVRRLRPEVHAPVVRRDPGPRRIRISSSAPATTGTLTADRPAGRRPAAPAAAAHRDRAARTTDLRHRRQGATV